MLHHSCREAAAALRTCLKRAVQCATLVIAAGMLGLRAQLELPAPVVLVGWSVLAATAEFMLLLGMFVALWLLVV
jgi:hypothetical protein